LTNFHLFKVDTNFIKVQERKFQPTINIYLALVDNDGLPKSRCLNNKAIRSDFKGDQEMRPMKT